MDDERKEVHTYIHTYILFAGAASICLMVLFAGMTVVSVVRKPADLSVWYGNDSIYNVLETHGLTHGYCTDYWYTNSITVLSDSRINVLGVNVTDEGFKKSDHQNKWSWYKEAPTEERTFLVCLEREFLRQHPWLADEAVEVLRATQAPQLYDWNDGFFILVYDHDIIAEKMQEDQAFGNAGRQISEN